jgi:glutathione synthase/RimK-type ligase-like ATP-grasp enzyme
MTIHVLHENDEWLPPFAEALDAEGLPWEGWFLDGGALDLGSSPPAGVFYSRMSASCHTRGHTRAKEHARSVLSWLEAHGRRVVNGRRVLELEMSKVDQLSALAAAGFDVPRTVAVVGSQRLVAEARRFPAPFVTKHNQGGKGLGVARFDDAAALERALAAGEFEQPVDRTWLLQEYVEPAGGFITRVEVVGGAFLYALKADTSHGFELCPADTCEVHDELCPAGPYAARIFSHRPDVDPALVERYLHFAARWGIEIAGFEFIESTDGRVVTYDVNTNTNYNSVVDEQAGRSGPREIARFLGRLHAELRRAEPVGAGR